SIICSPMTSLKTSIKTITYLSDIGCLEIQGASLDIISMAVILVVKRDHFPGVKDDMEADKRFASDCLFWGLKYGDRKIIPE
ncbi:hypothetical protein, partial [Escherichia coli]